MNPFSASHPSALLFAAGAILFGLWEGLGGLTGTDAEGKVTDVSGTCVSHIRRSGWSRTGETVTAAYVIDGEARTGSWCDGSPPKPGAAVAVCDTMFDAWEGHCGDYPATGGGWVVVGLISLAFGTLGSRRTG